MFIYWHFDLIDLNMNKSSIKTHAFMSHATNLTDFAYRIPKLPTFISEQYSQYEIFASWYFVTSEFGKKVVKPTSNGTNTRRYRVTLEMLFVFCLHSCPLRCALLCSCFAWLLLGFHSALPAGFHTQPISRKSKTRVLTIQFYLQFIVQISFV